MSRITYLFIIYFLFIGVINSFSQIIYHDLTPDVIFPSGTPPPNFFYNLDLDGDGTNDFRLDQYTSNSKLEYRIFALDSNKVRNTGFYSDADTLNYGDSIYVISNFNPFSASILAYKNYAWPFNSGGTWNNKRNRFIGVSFNTLTGLKYGWIRLLNNGTIADYAYNSTSNQPILAGEGLSYKTDNVKILDVDNFGNGKDIKISFFKPFDEIDVSKYQVIIVPSTNAANFTLDSARAVLSVNSFTLLPTNKDVDTVLNSSTKDVYGNFITSQNAYTAFVISLPNLISSFDTLMSEPSNNLTLNGLNFGARQLNVLSTKIPGSVYNLNIGFNAPVSETGILNYRLFFIQEKDSVLFTLDSANNVSPSHYLLINKTGTAQNLNFQSNVVKTYNGKNLIAFEKYRAVLMSVADTINANTSVLSPSSNSFTVYTQVQQVTEIIMSDIADNHDVSDINAYFTRVADESNISGYRGLVVPQVSLANFNLDSANSSLNYISFNKNGQDQNVQLANNLNDIHGNVIQESQMYYFFVLTMSDNNLSDVNALSLVRKYFGFSTPNFFIADKKDTSSVIYTDIQDTSFYGQAYIMPKSKSIDFNKDGIVDLVLQSNVWVNTGNSSVIESDYAIPKSNVQISSYTYSPSLVMVHDSADMIFNKLNWTSSSGVLKRIYVIGAGGTSGMWKDNEIKYLAVRLLDTDTTYAWVKLSVEMNGTLGMTIYDYGIQKKTTVIGVREKLLDSLKVNVYPNPASANATVIFEGYKKVDLELLDINGKVILNKFNVSNNYYLDTSSLVKGIYGLRISTQEGKSKVFKLMVQ